MVRLQANMTLRAGGFCHRGMVVLALGFTVNSGIVLHVDIHGRFQFSHKLRLDDSK